jgi:acyl-CoA thioesterase
MNFQEQMDFANTHNMFALYNGAKIVELDENHSLVKADFTKNSENAMGGIHGGMLFLLGDVAAGMLARATGHMFVTLDSSIRYLRDGRDAKILYSRGTLVKRGRTVTIVRSQITADDSDVVLAEGEFTFFCIDKK